VASVTVSGRRRLRARSWGIAASAASHVVLFAVLAWSLKDRLHLPRTAPIQVELVRLAVQRTSARSPEGVRPRAAVVRPKGSRTVTPLPIAPAPPSPDPASAPTVAGPREVQFAPPPPVLKGLAGCTDDPVRDPGRRPGFDGAVQAQADSPAYRMTGAKVRAWDAEVARRKQPAQPPFSECPLDSQASRLGFGCLPH
jgi:hypothetical protein